MSYPIEPKLVGGTIIEGGSFEIVAEAFQPGTQTHLEQADVSLVEYQVLDGDNPEVELHRGTILPVDIILDAVAVGTCNLDWFATPTILDQVGYYRYLIRIWFHLSGDRKLPMVILIEQQPS